MGFQLIQQHIHATYRKKPILLYIIMVQVIQQLHANFEYANCEYRNAALIKKQQLGKFGILDVNSADYGWWQCHWWSYHYMFRILLSYSCFAHGPQHGTDIATGNYRFAEHFLVWQRIQNERCRKNMKMALEQICLHAKFKKKARFAGISASTVLDELTGIRKVENIKWKVEASPNHASPAGKVLGPQQYNSLFSIWPATILSPNIFIQI